MSEVYHQNGSALTQDILHSSQMTRYSSAKSSSSLTAVLSYSIKDKPIHYEQLKLHVQRHETEVFNIIPECEGTAISVSFLGHLRDWSLGWTPHPGPWSIPSEWWFHKHCPLSYVNWTHKICNYLDSGEIKSHLNKKIKSLTETWNANKKIWSEIFSYFHFPF